MFEDMKRFEARAFLLLLAAATFLFGWLLMPFFDVLFWSVVIAVLFTLLLTLPVNAILLSYTGIPNLVTMLWWHPLLLIGLSVGLTFIAGLIPSRIAAAKDPVLALRSE